MKRLLLVPLVVAVLTASGMFLNSPSTFYRSILTFLCVAAAINSIVTSNRFAAGDRLHLAWLLFGIAYGLAALRHGHRVWALASGADVVGRMPLDAMFVLQNVLIALALWIFVRAWSATGLAVPASRRSQVTWTAVGIVLALVVGGYPLVRGAATADTSFALLVSTVGDVIGMALIAPLIIRALALRGGVLMHTWAYLAASEIAWMAYDIWLASEAMVNWPGPTGKGFEETFRIVAVTFAFIASIAQRRATVQHDS